MNIKRIPGLNVFLVLALLISMFSFIMPVTPVAAAGATSVTILSPASDNISYSHATNGSNIGTITVRYRVSGDGSPVPVTITVANSTTTVGSLSDGPRASDGSTIYPGTVQINVGAAAGTYNVTILAGTATSTNSNSVVIYNTNPTITVLSPNSSNGWSGKSGASDTYTFSVSQPATVSVWFEYNGGTYNLIYSGSVTGAYTGTLTVPDAALPTSTSGTGMLRFQAIDRYGNDSGYVYSQPFLISSTGPTAVVNTPATSGVSYNGNSTATITGSVTPNGGSSVYYKIGLFRSSDLVNPVDLISGGYISGTLASGTCYISYSWHVENNVSGSDFYIGIRGKDAVGIEGDWAFSPYTFRIIDIVKPVVTVTYPTAGTLHYSGASDHVDWTQTDNVPGNLSYQVWLSVNGGSVYPYLISAGSAAQGSVTINPWLIPAITPSTSCMLKVVVNDNENPQNVTTATSSIFTISGVGTITASITAPIGGESWTVGDTKSITWTATDSSSASAKLTYLIEFTADGGSNWATVANLTNQSQNSNTYSWAVADPHALNSSWTSPVAGSPSTNCKIRVTATNPGNSATQTAVSPSPFTINAPSSAVTTASITLKPGWNLISLELVPTNTNIQNVLSNAIPYVVSVWTCTGGGASGGSWSSWAPGAPSSLTTMVDGRAYWVNTITTTTNGLAPADVTFTFQGRVSNPPPSAPPTYSYPTGWNMVGYKSKSSHSASSYLGTQGSGTPIYNLPITGFNAATQSFTAVNSTDNLTPGQGYWIYYNSTGTISPPPD